MLYRPKATQTIITPSCLSVDKAMIFLKSVSVVALKPAISIVIDAEINRTVLNRYKLFRNEENRINKKTPAVTSVDEWTSAETGVGAAIAAGSQLENGVCALFVIAASRIDIIIKTSNFDCHMFRIIQLLEAKHRAIAVRIKASPSRFVTAVIMPAPRDLGFW